MLPVLLLALALPAHAAGTVDACVLLEDAAVEAALGAPVKERKPGTQSAGPLLTSQCFLATSSTKSVSVALTRGSTDGRSALTAREYWRRQFHGSERENEDDRRARPIAGIGDEAYWTGNRFAGALYVLIGDAFLRISVGGIRDENGRIEASETLARAALKGLRIDTRKDSR
jgi:hypothetical protein